MYEYKSILTCTARNKCKIVSITEYSPKPRLCNQVSDNLQQSLRQISQKNRANFVVPLMEIVPQI